MELILYFISYTDDDGDDLDQLVWATDARDARNLWRKSWGLTVEVSPDEIFAINLTPKHGPVPWHDVAGAFPVEF